VVPVRSLKERLVRLQNDVVDPTAPVTVSVPATVNTVTWAAISPPRGGWARLEPIESDRLRSTAEAGIARVAEAIPTGTGEQIVHRVRADVWSAPVEGAEGVPAGAGFGALSLGFLDGEDEVAVFETGTWTRLTTPKGHVLVKRRSSLL